MNRYLSPALFLFVFFIIFAYGCGKNEESKKISLEKREIVNVSTAKNPKNLHVAIGGMITPKEGFAYYQKLLKYLGDKIGMDVDYMDAESYAEINNMVETGMADAAFVCGKPYVDGHDKFGMELLVAPQAYGKTVYYSYIIVPRESTVKSLKELKGKTFAFGDPGSNSGKLVPAYMIALMNETPETFFSKYIYTYGHDKSIQAVAEGIVDGAAVDYLIWEYFNRINPELTSKTKIIEKSPPCGIPPVVVRSNLDPALKEKIKSIFLSVHEDEAGREILKGMMIDKFVAVEDSLYDSIRNMRTIVDKIKKSKLENSK